MGEEHARYDSLDHLQVLHSLYLHMAAGVALYEPAYDDRGEPVNYHILDANPQFLRCIGTEGKDIAGRLATELLQVCPT